MMCLIDYFIMSQTNVQTFILSLQLLMRFVDDFLLITREPEIARQFLTAVTEGKYIRSLHACTVMALLMYICDTVLLGRLY